jgi:drug/metabolite transporter (DMT)-like permease
MEITNERLNSGAAALAVLAVVLWGINSVSIKIALQVLPPTLTAAIRFCLGLLVIGAWAFLRHIPLRPGAGETKKLLYLALLFTAQIYLIYEGTARTLASRSTVFVSTYPFFTALFAHFMIGGDRLGGFKISGLSLAFCGVVLVFAENFSAGGFATLTGDLLVLASGLLLGFRQVYTKKLIQGLPPVKLLFWQALLSLPLLLALSAGLEKFPTMRLSAAVLASLLYQGLVVAGFCFILWTTLLRRHSVSRLTAFSFLSPVSGVIASSLLLAEPLTPALLAGLLLIAAGILLVNRRQRPELRAAAESKKKAFR